MFFRFTIQLYQCIFNRKDCIPLDTRLSLVSMTECYNKQSTYFEPWTVVSNVLKHITQTGILALLFQTHLKLTTFGLDVIRGMFRHQAP